MTPDDTGACTYLPPEEKAYFSGTPSAQQYAARRYCVGCPIRTDCLKEALAIGHQDTKNTVWGGLTTPQRASLARDPGAPILWPTPLRDGATRPSLRDSVPSSRFRGVSYYKDRWRAQLRTDKLVYLGVWPLTPEGEEAAARAYDQAAWKHKGLDAQLNFSRAEAAGYVTGSTPSEAGRLA